MADLTVTADKQKAKVGETITFSSDPPSAGVQWKVTFDAGTYEAPGQNDGSSAKVEGGKLLLAPKKPGAFRISATSASLSQTKTCDVEVASAGENEAQEPAQAPLVFDTAFAIVSAVVLLAGLTAFLCVSELFDLDAVLGDDAAKVDPRAALAGRLIGPTLALAAIVIAVGVWMVMTEWRGGFSAAKPDAGKKGLGWTEIISGLGKLKGSTLVLVSGVVLALSAAWMTSSSTATPDGGPAGGSPTSASSSAPASVPATPSPSAGG